MTTSLYLQYAFIGLLVLASALATLRKLAPAVSGRFMSNAASSLNRPGRPRAVQALGRWMQPAKASGDCGDGCSTCGSCDTGDQKPDTNEVHPLTFHVRKGQH